MSRTCKYCQSDMLPMESPEVKGLESSCGTVFWFDGTEMRSGLCREREGWNVKLAAERKRGDVAEEALRLAATPKQFPKNPLAPGDIRWGDMLNFIYALAEAAEDGD